MNTEVRRRGTETWIPVEVDLVSENGKSWAVSAESGLCGSKGVAYNRETGDQMLLLFKLPEPGLFTSLSAAGGEIWELRQALDAEPH